MNNMLLTTKKLAKRVIELKQYRLIKLQDLDLWKAVEDVTKKEKYPPKKWDFHLSIGDHWQGRDRYIWAHYELAVPDKNDLWLVIDFGRTGGGYNSGFESLLFINGEPYQGVDSNHTEVLLDQSYKGKVIALDLKLWSGLEGGGPEVIQNHLFRCAYLAQRNANADDLFFTADMVSQTIDLLDENTPVRYDLLNGLDQAFLLIDWQQPASHDFYQSVERANSLLQETLKKIPKVTDIMVTAIGHTHIDVAWLWRLKHTAEKAARSFSTVLRLMEQYPEYIFLQTQPQIYKYIKADYPEIYKKIKERINEGRWEVDGAMWLESDCNIPSGESLTRQILHGKKFIKDEFNKDVHYLWLPDVFGYSWALPQILKKSGIDTFMTTKISWNQFNRMPHDTFYWRGIDGTDVLTHFITTPVDGKNDEWAEEWFYTYNGTLEPYTVKGIYDGYQDKRLNKEFLLSYGHGDGGGGVTRDMLENRRRLDAIPGLPQVKTGTAAAYFDRLHETVKKNKNYVYHWDGELYLEYHRGTYTSQAYVKKMNRKSELALRELEILYASAISTIGMDYPKETLFNIWETVLRNQFHDIIPGSSIKEVYQDHKKEFEQVATSTHDLFNSLRQTDSDTFIVYNTQGWDRDGLVKIPLAVKTQFMNEQNEQLPSIFNGEEHLVYVPKVSKMGQLKLRTTSDEEEMDETKTAVFGQNVLETDHLKIRWQDDGRITSIIDKHLDREMLKGEGNILQIFEDKPLNYDAWDIDLFYQEKETILTASSSQIGENNGIFASINFGYDIGQSHIEQEMRVYKHTKRIDFVTTVDWHERQRLLKTKFELAIRTTEATYDIQYGNVKRPTHNNTSWQLAQFETVGHQWADISDKRAGASILNDCKYGYDIKENVIRLTLLKGAIYPDPTADIGHHAFTYSFFSHEGDPIDGKVAEEAWALNAPMSAIEQTDLQLLPIRIDCASSIMIDALKEAEAGHGYIFRFHDHTGGTRKIKLYLPDSVWTETNLMEEPLTDVRSSDQIEVLLEPYEIKTFLIYLKNV